MRVRTEAVRKEELMIACMQTIKARANLGYLTAEFVLPSSHLVIRVVEWLEAKEYKVTRTYRADEHVLAISWKEPNER